MPADMLTVELGNEFSFRASALALGQMDKNFQQRTETWGKTYSYLPSVFCASLAVRTFSMVPVKVWVTKKKRKSMGDKFPEKATDLKFTAHSFFSPQCPLTLQPPMEGTPERMMVVSSPPKC